MQVGDGYAEYIPSVLFERELARSGALRDMVDRFSNTLIQAMVQGVACNRFHPPEQRASRWLLGVHDRLGRNHFELRTGFLAHVTGAKHQDALQILKTLDDEGLVRHDGQFITILDAVGLRRRSCRCYEAIRRAYGHEPPARPRPASSERRATVVRMPRGVGACTLCGSNVRVPHRDLHQCMLALDEELEALVLRTHMLRKYRAQLLQDRLQVFRNTLKRAAVR